MRDLNDAVKQEMLSPFQAAEVRVRTQPYVAAYLTARVVMTRLDEVLPWQWSFKLAGPGVVDGNGVMHQDGILLVRHPDGTTIEFHDRGSAPPDVGKGQAKQAKHAVSDCFKRCAVHAGVGRYLYELQGVQAGRIPKASLEKALAAVGYIRAWDDRHHGAVGGVREADYEDEVQEEGGEAVLSPQAAGPGNGEMRGIEKTPSIWISADQHTVLKDLVAEVGGNTASEAWSKWLKTMTANGANRTDKILQEDYATVKAALEEIVAKKAAGKRASVPEPVPELVPEPVPGREETNLLDLADGDPHKLAEQIAQMEAQVWTSAALRPAAADKYRQMLQIPRKLDAMSAEQLRHYAENLRKYIADTAAEKGGEGR